MIQNLKKESVEITVKPKAFKFEHKKYRIYFIKWKPRFSGNPDLRDKSMLTDVSRKSGFDYIYVFLQFNFRKNGQIYFIY